jgi:hypothetical protein
VAQSTFTDSDSVFSFFLTFGSIKGGQAINFKHFEQGVNSLTAGRFKRSEIQSLWTKLVDSSDTDHIDKFQFRHHFESLAYRGSSSVKSLSGPSTSMAGSSATSMGTAASRFTIQTKTSSSSQWNSNIIEKLRVLI